MYSDKFYYNLRFVRLQMKKSYVTSAQYRFYSTIRNVNLIDTQNKNGLEKNPQLKGRIAL